MPLTKLNTQSATSLDATKLTGNLPAISGASLTGISAEVVKLASTSLHVSDNSVASIQHNGIFDDIWLHLIYINKWRFQKLNSEQIVSYGIESKMSLN